MYGNTSSESQEGSRIIPFLLSKIASPHFSYEYSRFNVCRSKEHTARIAVWRDLGSRHNNIFTMESSFCGPKPVKYEPHRGSKKQPTSSELNYHFNTQDYKIMGEKLCRVLLLYREEQESTMGFQNIEYQIQQYHMDRESKMQQEEALRQQQALIEQRKAQDIQNRMKSGGDEYNG